MTTFSPSPARIAEYIRAVLSDDLLAPPWKGMKDRRVNVLGHCYAASEAAYHFLGGAKSGWKAVFSRDIDDSPHWYLVYENGALLDITADQLHDRQYVYSRGRGKGFLTKKPSARAQEIIRRVKSGVVRGFRP